MKKIVKQIVKQIYARMWVALRILRLQFIRMPKIEDAKSQDEMLEEIRKKSGLI